ncbi:MAG: hypothetical protein QM731_08265 [Chitinophagaceae bacterium]
MKLVSTVALLLIGFTMNAQISSWRTVNKKQYSIQYPSTWTVDSSRQLGADLLISAPIDSISDRFKENIKIIIQNIAGKNVDMDRFVSVSEQQIKTVLPDCNFIESSTVTEAPVTYHKMLFTCTQGQLPLEIEQFYFVTSEKAYVITFTAEQRRFSEYQPVAEKILQSFMLKN